MPSSQCNKLNENAHWSNCVKLSCGREWVAMDAMKFELANKTGWNGQFYNKNQIALNNIFQIGNLKWAGVVESTTLEHPNQKYLRPNVICVRGAMVQCWLIKEGSKSYGRCVRHNMFASNTHCVH